MYRIDSYRMTARQAADEFARTAFENPRKVQVFKPTDHPSRDLCGTFHLVDGCRWYEVWLSFDKRYFNIEPVVSCP